MSGFKRNDIIKGANFFTGEIDGKQMDSGAIWIEEPLDESRGTSKGWRTVEYRCASSQIVKNLMEMQFPISAEVHFELVTGKRDQKITVVEIVPIKPVPGQPHPAQNKAAA
ncbi:MAG: hypothetical protein CGU28_02190 [Candidatus Dactylopiibacterium carminicum]|uniref:Uncharacterized protein n=1 Tax=Candidatus Dactylopiibacterium carminicum TaxID=857335 RepID=A0A272EVE3_9RHOO|nr:hypothetical protein [Candidatus Dactylopiibacterium carminicum]KAF7600096.1 hypothetical protein BGI27_04170 [Candidatus Dactylopiibacterium carminicum]PAS94074.1 MAG: hypothetical protein CGU29_05385 [Candidatus Dactylopiibacterium carminicum]PAS98163.1 MAG: hypothetical protein CGU28_02190 [Candidatus Dactylopiibacterium carminicum]PAT00098.1 MAG: hypothetical protein BSR46_04200 [Candidatus Dactylopiibacterium carminicum]